MNLIPVEVSNALRSESLNDPGRRLCPVQLRQPATLASIVGSLLDRVRYVVPSLSDTNASRWPTHPLWQAAQAYMVRAIEEHAFAPSPAHHGLLTPRQIKLDGLRRQLVGLAASCGALEGLPDDRSGDLPGLIAAVIREAERARPGVLEEKLARARARYGVLG